MAETIGFSGITSTNQIKYACSELRSAWPLIMKNFKQLTGNDLILTCTYRSPQEQQRLYSIGRTTKGKIITWVDGVTKKSNHNKVPARAIDVAVIAGGKVSWDPELYLPIGIICKGMGLTWGGFWKVKDFPHIELA